EKLQEAHLLLDNDKYYLALNKSPNAQLNQWGGTMTNVMYGLRAIIVNGWLYAFDRATGKAGWRHKAEDQIIIMEQIRDLPIVQFTARYHKPINRLGNAAQMVPFRSLHKRTGKLLMDEETLPQSSQHFYALNADPRSGRIELLSSNLKIVHEAA